MSESLKKSRKSRKTIVVAGTLTGVLVGGAAFAYWTTTGSGQGSASTAAGASNLSIVQTGTTTDIYPGGPARGIAGKVTNNADNSAYVNTVTASISGVTKAAGVSGDCSAADYKINNGTMNVKQDLAKGASSDFSGASIEFVNTSVPQDGCKGATVSLAFVSN